MRSEKSPFSKCLNDDVHGRQRLVPTNTKVSIMTEGASDHLFRPGRFQRTCNDRSSHVSARPIPTGASEIEDRSRASENLATNIGAIHSRQHGFYSEGTDLSCLQSLRPVTRCSVTIFKWLRSPVLVNLRSHEIAGRNSPRSRLWAVVTHGGLDHKNAIL
jgi:hypothetical protein